jgi:putative flippase GtrA
VGYVKKVIAFRVVRLLIIGSGNTAIDFAILNFVFYVLHQNKLASSFTATSEAVGCSFLLNRCFVFENKELLDKKVVLFILITGLGVLLIQNSIYVLSIRLQHHHEAGPITFIRPLSGIRLSSDFVPINLSNILGSLVVMFWNYNDYRLLVYRRTGESNDIVEDAYAAA